MDYKEIIFTKEEGIATLTMNRPDKLNALDGIILDEMADAIEDAGRDDEVKVLIITGVGRAFSSGGDVTPTVPGLDPTLPDIKQRSTRLNPFCRFGTVMRLLKRLDKPVLGAINGIAAGAGLSLAEICDIRIASENAKFSSIFVNVACNADTGTTYWLPRIVGIAKALELMWTGEIIDAREAERIGLVSRVVPHDDLMKVTRELASKIARGPSIANEFVKRLVYHGLESNNFEAQMAYEAFALSVCFQTEDLKEAVQAFKEKRGPIFKGR